MDQDDRLRHASSFGSAAVAYAEHRPDYAQAAVRWALEPAPGPRVLDLGAGTGKLTATLIALGIDVIAVEPDPAMLAELRRALVRHGRRGPGDRQGARTQRLLAGLWNLMDDRVPWVAELARVSGSAAIGPRDTPESWRAETAQLHLPVTGVVARFGSPEQEVFPHGQRRTADSLAATIATRAGLLVMPEQEQEATLGRIRAFLGSRPETTCGEFTLPTLTGVLRVRSL
ncbi:class I SAM-dependent methyltransferase [Oryzihumus leptocrescens]|uniref:Methyltransferase family protein n=1 Tax=Oryzihumus leptocrescens TaxID=297536 RepID=A0A542Z989_9MICO|nr:class I SAM-dependent methyltransferase [Oryzihumus leptocrescens]TQL56906.1 hypothetical protein FB474_3672 [Oryzihumus leptocrescens]